jgi:hypothetical protein
VYGRPASSTVEEEPSTRMVQSTRVISTRTVATEKEGSSIQMELFTKAVSSQTSWKVSAPLSASTISTKAVGEMARWMALVKVTGTTRTMSY